MFYVISKIFWPLLMPLTHILIGLFIATLAPFKGSFKTAKTFLVITFVYFILFGVFPVGHNMLVYLERQSITVDKPGKVPPYGIIFLGGGMDPAMTFKYQQPHGGASFDRVTAFMALIKQYERQNTRFVFSGGGGMLPSPNDENKSARGDTATKHNNTSGFSEADAFAYLLMRQDMSADRVIFESQSRNTAENANMTMDMMLPRPTQQWIIVTSAYHMPRAMASFKAAGWSNITPYAVDYQTYGFMRIMPSLNILDNMTYSHIAFREFFGNFAYFIFDKSTRPIL